MQEWNRQKQLHMQEATQVLHAGAWATGYKGHGKGFANGGNSSGKESFFFSTSAHNESEPSERTLRPV